jgi:oxygen-independent coproporphyrinogen III oxidase
LSGIYIHIPYCKQACHYCDFHFSTNQQTLTAMMDALIGEIAMRSKTSLPNSTIRTLYIGGGTPSLLPIRELERILNAVHGNFSLALEECTLEANPDDLNDEKLKAFRTLGIDRLSIGIQSFDDQILRYYNRAHSSKESLEAVAKSQNAGFQKLSIDLIYGFPHADHSLWQKDLATALTINPGHISSYSLTLEPKTALAKWATTGKFMEADEDFVAEQFEHLIHHTELAGYQQYEISNFAIPGQESIHNSNYWKGIPYIGIGPSAHSFDGSKRWSNVSNNTKYIQSIQKGLFLVQEENLNAQDVVNEYMLTSLRTIWGIDLKKLKEELGVDLLAIKKEAIAHLTKDALIDLEENRLRLTKKGKLLADSVASVLFID